ncbi:hypothetical protein AB0L40_21695 [Patulibacter sp. NPDC049589]|uniref:TetR/AcrR family transcriptional regulator n=1 Tax=Patulibacter sp. NPDC049589 TaxID=3154731 RepID=UPI0034207FEC
MPAWEGPPDDSEPLLAMLRSTITNEQAAEQLREFLQARLLVAISPRFGDDPAAAGVRPAGRGHRQARKPGHLAALASPRRMPSVREPGPCRTEQNTGGQIGVGSIAQVTHRQRHCDVPRATPPSHVGIWCFLLGN